MSVQNTSHVVPESKETSPIRDKSSEVTSSDHRETSQPISLLNFDPTTKNKRFLTSPRSIEALKRLCFEEYELLSKTKADFVGQPVPLEFADDKNYFYEVKAEHHEKRRKEKVKLALQERADIIKEEHKKIGGTTNFSTVQSSQEAVNISDELKSQSFYHSNLLDQGKKKIQQMRNQQKKEIEFIIQNDMKVQEMYKKNEEKLVRMQELEKRRLSEVEHKQKLSEIGKQKREAQKLEREKEQEEVNKIMIEKYKEEEIRRAEIQEKLREEREKELLKREKERKEKTVVREKRMEEFEVQKREYVEKKKEERDARFIKIKEQIEEKHRRKQKEAVQVRRNFEVKIDAVKKRFEDDKEVQRRRLVERQSVTISKRERIEEEKKMMLDYRRNKSEAKVQEIRRSLDERFQEEQAKKATYLYKYKQAEENKRMREIELEEHRKWKSQMEAQKEVRIKQVLAEKDKELQVKSEHFLEHINHEQSRAVQQKEVILQNLKKKYIEDLLKMEDAHENNKRLEKIREKKRNFFLEKIAEDTEKLEHHQIEKEKAMQEKKRLVNQLEAEKAQALKDFEKRKKHLLNNKNAVTDLSYELKADTSFQQNTSKNPQTSQSQKRLVMLADVRTGARSAKNIVNRVGQSESIIVANEPNSSINVSHPKILTKAESRRPNQSVQLEPSAERKTEMQKNLFESPYLRAHKASSSAKTLPKPTPPTHNTSNRDKGDTIISELQTKEYQKESSELREKQMSQLVDVMSNAIKEDADMKKIDNTMHNLVAISKQQEEEARKVKAQNNFLQFA